MVDDIKNPNRIPFESLTDNVVSGWALPTMNGRGRILKSAEIEKKQAQSRKNEKVEDVSAAQKPKPMTAEQLQNLSEEARKEGYAEGYAEGLKKGTDQGLVKGTQQGQEKAYRETKADVLETQNRLRSIAQHLFEPMQQQSEQLENTLVDMAINLAKHLINQEITQSPAVLYHVVHRAVSALPVGEKNITVMLNDADADLIENLLTAKKSSWIIERDDTITRGGCMVKTENSLIDYEIENRLKQYFDDVNYLDDEGVENLPEIADRKAEYADELADMAAREARRHAPKVNDDDQIVDEENNQDLNSKAEKSEPLIDVTMTDDVKNTLVEKNDEVSFKEERIASAEMKDKINEKIQRHDDLKGEL